MLSAAASLAPSSTATRSSVTTGMKARTEPGVVGVAGVAGAAAADIGVAGGESGVLGGGRVDWRDGNWFLKMLAMVTLKVEPGTFHTAPLSLQLLYITARLPAGISDSVCSSNSMSSWVYRCVTCVGSSWHKPNKSQSGGNFTFAKRLPRRLASWLS